MSPNKFEMTDKATASSNPSQRILELISGPERQVLTLLASGRSIAEIAYTIGEDSDFVLNLRASIASKLLKSCSGVKVKI
jgi:FixJ family two-component response regulator